MIRQHHRRALVALLAAGATTLSLTAAAAQPAPARGPAARTESLARHGGGHVDLRSGGSDTGRLAVQRGAAKAAARSATKAFVGSLGRAGVVDLNGATGTPRMVIKRGGFLTGPSRGKASAIALRYVAAHAEALGLASSDLASFRLRRDYVDIAGVHHLSFTQTFRGATVFGNGLRAAVTRDGRLLMLGGSPVPGALVRTPAKATISAAAASKAAGAVGKGSATKVLFVTRGATYLGWRTVSTGADASLRVVDAATGKTLYRQALQVSEAKEAVPANSTGVAFKTYRNAKQGGGYNTYNFTALGWLSGTATTLSGNNAHAFSDVNDNDTAQSTEEVGPKTGHSWAYKMVPFKVKNMTYCGNPYPCSWDPNKRGSWKVNRKQNTTQLFWFVNNFHDYLEGAPVGFTEAAGNFQVVNDSGLGVGGDAVQAQSMDGANTASGLPDGNHIDNANMATPPDGTAPIMQMYLMHFPGTKYPSEDPFPANNTGDQADVVYHEYTHGLSNRLVVDSGGNSTLSPIQGGSMGEGWSDWYAADYLVSKGLWSDKSAPDVRMGLYNGAGMQALRYEALDCPVGSSTDADCRGAATGHRGGFTYKDFGKIFGVPEVHADGEIWAQTLWDLRKKLGHAKTANLVSRGMELAADDPSYLDMRDGILAADTANYAGANQATIWGVFAKRGMGYYAGSLGSTDTKPAADFTKPPTAPALGSITGTVTDSETGAPVSGASVTLAFQGSGTVNPSTVTAANGTYTLSNIPVGHYGKLAFGGLGYEPKTTPVDVVAAGVTKSAAIRRDWAAFSGGGAVTAFDGPDYTPFGCGPGGAIDLSLATGWGSTTGNNNGDPTRVFVPKSITLHLSQSIDVTGIGVDPGATCGDGASASLGKYKLETSPDATTWVTVKTGKFTSANNGHLNVLALTTGNLGVNYVRLTMQGNQTPNFGTSCPSGPFSGCSFTDLSEISVYGTPAI